MDAIFYEINELERARREKEQEVEQERTKHSLTLQALQRGST
jgi:hypothetical protein